ncbi:phosphate ABC transporter substrate-binding protein PstS [Acidicapsa dinghuensis]|uniref:Phosphate-binding protein n=1 Tax=Acidicapsa dinghuensis TaxID=2218256 RepID=A0ABW1EFT9_9BACT|nr:phosphate ABC transporter substrate-binding protein PstS [Acidicapsa dinghuensis]
MKKNSLWFSGIKTVQTAVATTGILLLTAVGTAQAQKLTGAGSTFDNPIFTKWFSEYSAAHPGVEINYQSIGSGGGIKQVTAGLVDFGATDGPMTDEQLAASKIKLIHIPAVLGAVVPIFNVPGVNDLKFAPDVLADIFLGKISNWDDARIAKDNPGAKLPNLSISVVHRAEGSGTTFIFSDYLSKVSKDWENGPGRGSALNWPKGIGGKGNDGVAGYIRQLPGSIGYVELIYALQNHIAYGEVRNAAGHWVKASIAGVTAAAASVKQMPADYRVSITNAPGADAYPISSFSWLLIPTQGQDAAKRKVLKDFLNWMLIGGEKEVSSLYYAPLPDSLIAREHQTVDNLK